MQIAVNFHQLCFAGKQREKLELFAILGKYTIRVAHPTQVAWFQCRRHNNARLEYWRHQRGLQHY